MNVKFDVDRMSLGRSLKWGSALLCNYVIIGVSDIRSRCGGGATKTTFLRYNTHLLSWILLSSLAISYLPKVPRF